jgi:hypothetical protein
MVVPMFGDKNGYNRWNQQSSEICREIERKAIGRMPISLKNA